MVLGLIADNEDETIKKSEVQDLLNAIIIMGHRLWVHTRSPNGLDD